MEEGERKKGKEREKDEYHESVNFSFFNSMSLFSIFPLNLRDPSVVAMFSYDYFSMY